MGFTFLMADDTCEEWEVYGSFIRAQGHEVRWYSDSWSIRQALEEGLDYDIAIVDRAMPGVHRTELVELLKEHRPNKPVIVMSGYTDIVPGADAMLVKPFGYNTLAKKVNIHLPNALENKTHLDY